MINNFTWFYLKRGEHKKETKRVTIKQKNVAIQSGKKNLVNFFVIFKFFKYFLLTFLIFQGRVQIIVKFDYFIFCDLTFRILYYII